MKKKIRIRPLWHMVLIHQDADRNITSGGIILPDDAKIPTLTGRIVRIPQLVENNEFDFPFRELDRVIFDTREAIPMDLEPGNKYFLVDARHILAVEEEEEK